MVISNEQFAAQVNEHGGASRNMATGAEPKGPGVMVSHAGSEHITDAPLTADQAKRYKRDNSVKATDHDYHGAWQEDGKVYQDLSRPHATLDKARHVGEKENQIAGYDLGGTDKSRPEGGTIYFDRRMPGTDANPKFKSSSESTSEYEKMSPTPSPEDREKYKDTNRGATYRGKPITINEVMGTISENRRKKREQG